MEDSNNQSQELASESGETLRAAEADGVAGLAGRELDAAIAERVMGWREGDHPEKNGTGQWFSEYGESVYFFPEGGFRTAGTFCPSDDIAAAMEVLMTFQFPTTFTIERNRYYYNSKTDDGWRVVIEGPLQGGHAVGSSLPETICRAALQAANTASGTTEQAR